MKILPKPLAVAVTLAFVGVQSSVAQPDVQHEQEASSLCGWIGVRVGPMTAGFANSLGMAEPYGAIFEEPESGSPAANAHIESGDVLTTINGSPLTRSSDFATIISMMAPDTVVDLNTWRNGELILRSVTLGSSKCPHPSDERSSISLEQTPVRSDHPLTASATVAFDTNQLGPRAPLLLRGIVPLIDQSPKLQAEVYAALTELGITVDEVTCSGNQFPGQWNNLAGRRVAPYACNFTNKWLSVNATVIITGPKGEVYDTITPAAIEYADKTTERTPTWQWTTERPTGG
jgi:hypothetical protein